MEVSEASRWAERLGWIAFRGVYQFPRRGMTVDSRGVEQARFWSEENHLHGHSPVHTRALDIARNA